MNKNKLCMIGGLLLLAAALCMIGYNLWDAHRAAKNVKQILLEMPFAIGEKLDNDGEADDSDANSGISGGMESDGLGKMPEPAFTGEVTEVEISGHEYIGTLTIPALELVLPVMSEWSDSNLKISPCRYDGSVDSDDLIIAGHNYAAHFGKLKDLAVSDEVTFTGVTGNAFLYVVSKIERLDPDDVKEMESGDWDLTLFTCTVGGQARVTIRCVKAEAY